MSSNGWVSPLPASRGFQRGNTSPSQAQSRSLLQQSPRAARVASPLPLPTSTPALPAVPSHSYRSSSHVETNKHIRRTSESETEEATAAQPSQLTASPAAASAARLSSSLSSNTSSTSTSSSRSSSLAADHLHTSTPPPPTAAATAISTPSSSPFQVSGRADASGWEDDDAVHECRGCSSRFSLFLRKHHCRQCGLIFCDGCSRNRRRVRGSGDELVRVCDGCDASIGKEGEDDRQRAAESASVHATQPTPRPSPSPPPQAGNQHAEPTSSSSSAQRSQPQHQTSQSLSSIPNVRFPSSSSSSSSAPSEAAAAVTADSGDRSALVSALLDELLCADAVLRHAKLVRDEMEATVMQLVTEIVEREREATPAVAAGDAGKKLETEAGAAAGLEAEEEMKLLRDRVDELQRENARLRARLEQQTVR